MVITNETHIHISDATSCDVHGRELVADASCGAQGLASCDAQRPSTSHERPASENFVRCAGALHIARETAGHQFYSLLSDVVKIV